ncbi:MAG: hypothetical protein ACO3EH_00485 [Ilumatobacteraceae bacterium]
MIKRNYGDMKEELRRVAGQTGLVVDDARLKVAVNLAQERLCTLGEWPYQYARLKFCQKGGVIALPTQYEALVHTAINREPVETQPPWFEFLEYGPGPYQKNEWCQYGLDMGESPVTFQPGASGCKVRITSTNGADSGNVVIRGYDTNMLAQTVTLALPSGTSTVKFSQVTQVTKPVTLGDVVISLIDNSGRQYAAGEYRSRDTNPTFRCYRFTTIADDQSKTVDAIVRRRLQDIASDSDEMFVTNVGALRLAVKAVALLDKGDLAASEAAFAASAQVLRDEANLYRSSRQPAPVNVTRIASMTERTDIY